VTDLWYYTEGKETHGPISAGELIALVSKLSDPRGTMIWRHGFDDWKPIEDVREIAQQILRPPPLRVNPPQAAVPPSASIPPVGPIPSPPAVREPAVDAADAAAFAGVQPEPAGIGGWLVLIAIGQVIGILKALGGLGKYYSAPEVPLFFSQFPAAAWGEAAMYVATVGLAIYTTALLFGRSRKFPRFFVYEWLVAVCLPAAVVLWVAATVSFSSGRSFFDLVGMDPQDRAQTIAAAIGAVIWVSYIRRSRRVANTFTR
jgi:hypothetical protein